MSRRPLSRSLLTLFWTHLEPFELKLAMKWPSIGRPAVKERGRRDYPGTKGSPGGKLPAGNCALRSPAFNLSAAFRKSETNQEKPS